MNAAQKATNYIKKIKASVNPMYRPLFHYSSEAGWINDPNGFSRFKGEYHLFAQHNPYDSKWGPMHWSHAKSHDLITWDHLPVALAPEESYECDLGCFSGTAIEHEGQHILMYTSCEGKIGEPVKQQQCLAIGDGVTYEKFSLNPVLTEKDLPDFVTLADFRDPKLIKRGNQFYVLIGAQVTALGVGTILMYQSTDLISWSYVGEVLRAPADGSMGIVFECPDLFKIDGKDIIVTSPINMPSEGDRFENISSVVYFVGEMNFETAQFTVEHFDELDGGFDFYAPQATETPDGKMALIGWAQMWERNFVTDQLGHGWAGSMSLPRELALQNNQLIQKPWPALVAYHGEKTTNITALNQRVYRLKIALELTGTHVKLDLLKTSAGAFTLTYDVATGRLVINREQSLFKLDRHEMEKDVHNCRQLVLPLNQTLELDIVVDNSIIEVYVNGGTHVLTSVYYVGTTEVTSAIQTDCPYCLTKIELKQHT